MGCLQITVTLILNHHFQGRDLYVVKIVCLKHRSDLLLRFTLFSLGGGGGDFA